MSLRAFAKINLTLEVIRKRPDGYHDLASLVQTISLADRLELRPAPNLGCAVDGMELDDDANLVVIAARKLAARLGQPAAADITLRKRIPAAAGLGGGSSDAAAALRGLRRLWGAPRALDLAPLALELGSDVPFFLRGGAAVLGGRGEIVRELRAPFRPRWLVLLVPGHRVASKTARLYGALGAGDLRDGSATRAAARRLAQGRKLRDADLVNSFSPAARATFPGLSEIWAAASLAAGRPFHLSGAGPALFAFADNRAEAHRLARRLRAEVQAPTFTARTVSAGASRRAATTAPA